MELHGDGEQQLCVIKAKIFITKSGVKMRTKPHLHQLIPVNGTTFSLVKTRENLKWPPIVNCKALGA